MTTSHIINPRRVRKIRGSFGFIPHRFLRDGFLSSLKKNEIVLYLFWILAADRYGVSYYGDVRICKELNLSPSDLQTARESLMQKELISFQAPHVQVLELPTQPVDIDRQLSGHHSFKALHQMLER